MDFIFRVSMCWYAKNVERRGVVSRERGLFPGMLGSKWRMCTLQTSFYPQLQLSYSVPALTCRRSSDLFIYTSSWCCSCISISAALQILSVRGFNRSQSYPPFPNAKTEPCAYHTNSSSCYVSPTAPSHSV